MSHGSIRQFIPFAWSLAKRRPWNYAGGILAVVVLDGIDMIPALLVRQITNKVQAEPNTIDLYFYTFALVGCYLLISILRMAWRFLLMIPSRSIEREVRQDCYERLLQADYSAVSRLKIGDVVSTLSQDISNIRMFMGPGILILFDSLAYLIFIPATLFYIVGPGASWVLFPFIILAITIWVVHKPLEIGNEAVSNTLGELSQYVFEESQGAKFFRAEGLIELRRHKYDILINGLLRRQLGNAKWELGLDGILQTVIQVSYLMVLVIAWKGQAQAAQNLGTLTVSLQLLDKLLWPFMATSYMMGLIQSAAAGAKRLKTVGELPLKHLGETPLQTDIKNISVQNLTLKTTEGLTLLTDVSLSLKAGERVALVGEVGSGKTILLQALAGLWEPSQLQWEKFEFNGVDYNSLDRTSYWKQLSYVPQTPQIFGKSLAQNLSPHLPLNENRLNEALEAADLASDVRLFPEGLRTSIGEKGLNLSGGQKQRTLIARSFHSGANVFLWDDAISALDPNTERRVIGNLKRLSPSAILVLATHRLSALKEFDRIFVFRNGKIIRQGSFEEIKRDQDLFKTLKQIEMEALSKT